MRNVLILSDSLRVRTFKEALIKNHTKEMKTSRASRESMQRVTTVESGRSVKCNAFFAFWILLLLIWGPGGGALHTLPMRVCAAQRGRDFEAPDLERGIHFRGVF